MIEKQIFAEREGEKPGFTIPEAIGIYKTSKRSNAKKIKDEDLVLQLNQKAEAAKAIRKPLEEMWYRNLVYLHNKLYAKWNEKTGALRKEWKPRKYVPVNLMFKIYQSKLAQLMAMPLTFVSDPGSLELQDELAAKYSEKILNNLIKYKIEEKIPDLLFYTMWVNRSLFKVYWDKDFGDWKYDPIFTDLESEGKFILGDKGEPLVDKESGQPIFHKVVEGIPQFNMKREGDFRISVISPFEYVVDPMAKGCDVFGNEAEFRARWLRQEKIIDETTLKEKYKGFDIEKVTFTDQIVLSGVDEKVATLKNQPTKLNKQKTTTLYEYWELPSVDFPDGRLITYVEGGVVLQNEALPKTTRRLNRLPFVDLCEVLIPYRYWGETVMEKVAPLQKSYAENVSHLAEIAGDIGKIVAYIQGSERITKEVGDFDFSNINIRYGGVQQPNVTTVDTFPMTLIRKLDRDLMDMEMVSGTSEMKYPLREKTATEIIKTEEQDASRLSLLKKDLMRVCCDTAWLCLETMKDQYDMGREVEVTGEYGFHEVVAWNKTKLKDKFNITIQSSGLYYGSRYARILLLKDIAGLMPLIQDPQQLNKYSQVLTKSIDDILEVKYYTATADQLDIRRATKENYQVSQMKFDEEGKVLVDVTLTVEPFDNDDVHIETHDNYVKGNYESLNSYQINKIEVHSQFHKDRSLQKKLELMQKVQAMQTTQPINKPTSPIQPTGEESGTTEV